MFTAADRKLTGICAVLVGALSLIMVPLYFVYSGPPPANNVLARNLLTVAIFTILLAHLVGLRRMFGREGGLAADISVVCGIAYAVVTLVSASLETGVAMQFPDGSKDPTTYGPLANGMVLLHGPIARMLIAAHLVALAIAVTRTEALARWVRTGALTLAVINLAFIPSLFFGMNPAHFYAANGWGSTASIGGIFMLWIGAVGVSVMRSTPHRHAARAVPEVSIAA